MFPFPTAKRDAEGREQWKRAVNRPNTKKPWMLLEPTQVMRVCSAHFIDGKPTAEHPDPTLNLGYNPEPPRKVRRVVNRHTKTKEPDASASASASSSSVDSSASSSTASSSSVHSSFCTVALMSVILILVSIIISLQKEIQSLKSELAAKHKASCKRPGTAAKYLKTDADVLFFTGIPTRNLIYELHDYTAKFVRRHWKGIKNSTSKIRKFINSPSRLGPLRKLSSVDEFLLTCMKLKLGLLNYDLASRFDISAALTSNIFHTWLNAMHKTIGKYVYWASKQEIILSKPHRYRHLPNLRAVIDCSETFIETPKDAVLQTSTWSDYKHHNTLKFLIAVAPNSAITFVSPACPGRHSDTQVTRSSGFFDGLDQYDEIMADRGFLIQSDCDIRHVTLSVPPTKRDISQMTTAAVMKTKRIANLRIIVEQVIRHLKTFRILSTEMPITVVPLASKIIVVCAGLSNLRNPLYKS